jgi:hypothetical protein
MKSRILLSIGCCIAISCGAFTTSATETQVDLSTQEAVTSSVMFRQDTDGIKQSIDNGETWELHHFENSITFFDYEEYVKWVTDEVKAIQKLVDAGEWTQEQANLVITQYDEIMAEMESGLMVSKRSSYDEAQVFFSYPVKANHDSF